MPSSRQKNVPDSNILDLRQLLASETTPARRTPRAASWLRRRSQPTADPILHDALPTRRFEWPRLRREVLKFIIAVAIVGVPVVGVYASLRVLRAANATEALATTGAAALQRGGAAIVAYDSDAAAAAFAEAENTFSAAEATLQGAVWSQTRLASRVPVVGKKFQTGLAAIRAARHIVKAGAILSTSLTGVRPATSGVTIETSGVVQGSVGVLGPMLRQPQSFRQGLASLMTALEELRSVDANAVPPVYAEFVRTWQQLEPFITEPDGRGEHLADFLTGMLAGDETKEWLIVFQNHDELRATGGFIGTFMMVKFEKGVLKVLDAPVTGPFDLSVQIPQTSLPPQPILAVAPYWTFHDANWFLDVPTSSQFLLDFYEQARGFKPNGIIYLTPGLIESLLRITGPVRPEGYGVDITADNFVRATEEQVEFKYNKALNNPKKFLLDMVPTLMTALTKLDATEGMLAAGVTLQHADQADLLFYSDDTTTQTSIRDLGWSGALAKAPDDFLAVVTSNLGGGKTDRVIDESVAVTVTPEARGLVHTVKITRRHSGLPSDPLAGLTNRSFIRVYAPRTAQFIKVEGASSTSGMFQPPAENTVPSPELLAAEGTVLIEQAGSVRLTEETGRKTFGAWSVLPAGLTKTLTFTYTTPLPANQTWTLVWQKQPGAPRRTWTVTYQPGGNQSVRDVIGGGERVGGAAKWQTNSDQTRVFGVVTR